jgi:uncharacterized protein YifN (PemK superfamily)
MVYSMQGDKRMETAICKNCGREFEFKKRPDLVRRVLCNDCKTGNVAFYEGDVPPDMPGWVLIKNDKKKKPVVVRPPKASEHQKLMIKYGITEELAKDLLERRKGKCEICGNGLSEKLDRRVLYIDHCHKTDRVRGVLCGYCNNVLGFSRDDPRILANAIEYLDKYRS